MFRLHTSRPLTTASRLFSHSSSSRQLSSLRPNILRNLRPGFERTGARSISSGSVAPSQGSQISWQRLATTAVRFLEPFRMLSIKLICVSSCWWGVPSWVLKPFSIGRHATASQMERNPFLTTLSNTLEPALVLQPSPREPCFVMASLTESWQPTLVSSLTFWSIGRILTIDP